MNSDSVPSLINRQRLLDRFFGYVRIETTANPNTSEYPSSPGQWELGRHLVEQLQSLSLADVHQDENGLVWATIPGNDDGQSPTVALIAHLDTSPESPGRNVQPQVIENYSGGDIPLAEGRRIPTDSLPEQEQLIGKTLITSDGSTLLGGDDKAGVAIIMELAAHLTEHPELPHGPVRLLFTCDEEIGRGTDKIDLKKLGSKVGYTLDGGGAGQIDVETFSASAARVVITGNNIHPAIAKNQMANAVRAASDFIAQLPSDRLTPETTEGREGFIHPHNICGGVAKTTVDLIIRSFDADELAELEKLVQQVACEVASQSKGISIKVTIQPQYQNLGHGLRTLPESIELAEKAFQNLHRPCERTIVRGGTDGSQLTEKGLPTPNLSSGQYNIHALQEFACLDEMVEATEHLVELLDLWSQFRE